MQFKSLAPVRLQRVSKMWEGGRKLPGTLYDESKGGELAGSIAYQLADFGASISPVKFVLHIELEKLAKHFNLTLGSYDLHLSSFQH